MSNEITCSKNWSPRIINHITNILPIYHFTKSENNVGTTSIGTTSVGTTFIETTFVEKTSVDMAQRFRIEISKVLKYSPVEWLEDAWKDIKQNQHPSIDLILLVYIHGDNEGNIWEKVLEEYFHMLQKKRLVPLDYNALKRANIVDDIFIRKCHDFQRHEDIISLYDPSVKEFLKSVIDDDGIYVQHYLDMIKNIKE